MEGEEEVEEEDEDDVNSLGRMGRQNGTQTPRVGPQHIMRTQSIIVMRRTGTGLAHDGRSQVITHFLR